MLNNCINHEDLDFDYSEITTGIQVTCLEILKEIHRICIKYDIKYSLGAGTVIGYKLFSGFIPWDDDIDLLMTRTNYEKFIEVFPLSCRDKYEIIHYSLSNHYNALYAKVCDKTTTIVEKPNGRFFKSGAFIDISVLDAVPNKFFHKKAMLCGKIAYAQLYRECGFIPDFWLKKIGISILTNDVLYANRKRLYKWYEGYCRSKNSSNYMKYGELMVKNFWNSLYDKYLFDSYMTINFEGVETFLITRYDEFLFQKYHKIDFVRNQPKSKRQKSHCIYFSDSIGYNSFDLEQYKINQCSL